jgi:hypothetical protein
VRRADLVVGGEYYYDRSTKWEQGTWRGGHRAVVVRVDPHKQRAVGRDPVEVPTGPGVLVDLFDSGGPWRTVVSIVHLRGPWQETKDRVDAAQHAREAANAARQSAHDDLHAAAVALRLRAEQLGIASRIRQTDPPVSHSPGRFVVELNVNVFAALLDRLEGRPVP